MRCWKMAAAASVEEQDSCGTRSSPLEIIVSYVFAQLVDRQIAGRVLRVREERCPHDTWIASTPASSQPLADLDGFLERVAWRLDAGSSALLYSVALIFICRWKSLPTSRTNGLDDLQHEARAVLERAAVLVRRGR